MNTGREFRRNAKSDVKATGGPTLKTKDQRKVKSEPEVHLDRKAMEVRSEDWRLVSEYKMFRPGLNLVCRHSVDYYRLPRFVVPDDKADWDAEFPDYDPPFFEDQQLIGQFPWADPKMGAEGFEPHFNLLDDHVRGYRIERRASWEEWTKDGAPSIFPDVLRLRYNATSFPYRVERGYPLNPCGRTGLAGRGNLPCWAVNYSHLVAVSKWKRWPKELHAQACHAEVPRLHRGPVDKLPTLQVLVARRKECTEWGLFEYNLGKTVMHEADDLVVHEAVRKSFQEAVDGTAFERLEFPGPYQHRRRAQENLDAFLASRLRVYRGYLDDHRNTDNAWLETVVLHYHDETGLFLDTVDVRDEDGGLKWWYLRDDGSRDEHPELRWMDLHENMRCCAAHVVPLEKMAQRLELRLFDKLSDRRNFLPKLKFLDTNVSGPILGQAQGQPSFAKRQVSTGPPIGYWDDTEMEDSYRKYPPSAAKKGPIT